MKTISTYADYKSAVKEANRHNELYFVYSAPEITDAEFDKLMKVISEYESAHPEDIIPSSPTQYVGPAERSGSKVVHKLPMRSLDKVYTYKDLEAWVKKSSYQRFVAEFKYNGLAVSIIYKKGVLCQASTRGDGYSGLDVTEAVKHIGHIPHRIIEWMMYDEVEVRGEVVILNTAFAQENRNRDVRGETPFASPRNAASGILRSQDYDRASLLSFYPWELHCVNSSFQEDAMVDLLHLGFNYAISVPVEGLDTIGIVQRMAARKECENIPVDGVVIKYSAIGMWETAGHTQHHCNYQIAFKFAASEDDGTIARTTLSGVEFMLANSGRITPVAVTPKVNLYGNLVGRFNLASMQKFNSLGPWRIGDSLLVTRSGECVPNIVEHYHDGAGQEIVFPTKCPSCGGKLTVEGAFVFCRNTGCMHQMYTPQVQRQKNAEASMKELFPDTLEDKSKGSSKLSGHAVVVSGTFASPAFKTQLKGLVKKHGGVLRTEVSSATTLLVAGDKVGPAKFKTAQKYGIRVVSAEDFLKMIS